MQESMLEEMYVAGAAGKVGAKAGLVLNRQVISGLKTKPEPVTTTVQLPEDTPMVGDTPSTLMLGSNRKEKPVGAQS